MQNTLTYNLLCYIIKCADTIVLNHYIYRESSKSLPTSDSEIYAAAAANVESILPTFNYAHEDFLNDFGLSEVFFIDGDSLVSHVLSNKTLDWKHGGQYLNLP